MPANHTFVCSVPRVVLNKFKNEECGLNLIDSADFETCSFYNSTINDAFECQARECGFFNIYLLLSCIGFGGIAGGLLLYLLSGCSCVPSGELRFHSRRLADAKNEEAFDSFDLATMNDDKDETLALTDGIHEGEEGVILQLIVEYLETKSAEKHPDRHKLLAWIFIFLMFIKKLGLKLVILVPLITNRNIVSAASYAVDVFVFFYFGVKGKYFPGSLSNEIYALCTGRKLRKVAPSS
jgi:hypothetical protein